MEVHPQSQLQEAQAGKNGMNPEAELAVSRRATVLQLEGEQEPGSPQKKKKKKKKKNLVRGACELQFSCICNSEFEENQEHKNRNYDKP